MGWAALGSNAGRGCAAGISTSPADDPDPHVSAGEERLPEASPIHPSGVRRADRHSGGNLKLTADARGFHPSSVGEEGGEDIAVTNNDTDIGDLVIFYANGDNWLDHHVATDLGGCTIDKGQDLFRCGPLAAGQTRTILIRGTAKDRGNYNYRWGLGDGGSNFRQWGTDFTWSEAIT